MTTWTPDTDTPAADAPQAAPAPHSFKIEREAHKLDLEAVGRGGSRRRVCGGGVGVGGPSVHGVAAGGVS